MRKPLTEKQKEDANKRSKAYYLINKKLITTKSKVYKEKNKKKLDSYQEKYRKANAEKNRKYASEYYKNNKKTLLIKQKRYQTENKTKRNTTINIRKKTDIVFRLTCNVRSYISITISKNKLVKKSKLNDILGCTIEKYRLFLESQFLPWMNWDNYGLYNGAENYGWDIDHIKPLSSAKSLDELMVLFNFTNTKPLCSYTNRNIKRNSISF